MSFKAVSTFWLSVNLISIDDLVFPNFEENDEFPAQLGFIQPLGDQSLLVETILLVLSSEVLPDLDLQLFLSCGLKLWDWKDLVTSSNFCTLFVVLLNLVDLQIPPLLHFAFLSTTKIIYILKEN